MPSFSAVLPSQQPPQPSNQVQPKRFRMSSRPNLTHLTIQNISLSNIDIVWDNLKYLKASHPPRLDLDRCMELMQQVPLLKYCSLSMYFNLSRNIPLKVPKTTVKYMRLRKLELRVCHFPIDKLIEFLNLMELPSFEEYHCQSNEGDILAESIVSLINKSGSRLKVLKLELNGETPAMEDINNLLDTVPYLQEFQLELAFRSKNRIRYGWSLPSSPPVLQGGAPGLLLDLKSLKLFSGEGYIFDCIPDIFGWPHRKILSLQADGNRKMVLDDDTKHKISKLVNQNSRYALSEMDGVILPFQMHILRTLWLQKEVTVRSATNH